MFVFLRGGTGSKLRSQTLRRPQRPPRPRHGAGSPLSLPIPGGPRKLRFCPVRPRQHPTRRARAAGDKQRRSPEAKTGHGAGGKRLHRETPGAAPAAGAGESQTGQVPGAGAAEPGSPAALTWTPGRCRCAALSGGSVPGPGHAWGRGSPWAGGAAVGLAGLERGGGARPAPPPAPGVRVWSRPVPPPRPVPSRAALRCRCRCRCRCSSRPGSSRCRSFLAARRVRGSPGGGTGCFSQRSRRDRPAPPRSLPVPPRSLPVPVPPRPRSARRAEAAPVLLAPSSGSARGIAPFSPGLPPLDPSALPLARTSPGPVVKSPLAAVPNPPGRGLVPSRFIGGVLKPVWAGLAESPLGFGRAFPTWVTQREDTRRAAGSQPGTAQAG